VSGCAVIRTYPLSTAGSLSLTTWFLDLDAAASAITIGRQHRYRRVIIKSRRVWAAFRIELMTTSNNAGQRAASARRLNYHTIVTLRR
jgi:hypothetical protein